MAKLIDPSTAYWLICSLLLATSASSWKITSNRPDILRIGQKLDVSNTLTSAEGLFELGFFSPGNSTNYYLGIWFKKTSSRAVVWVANRSNPLSKSPVLTFQKDGNLVLTDAQTNSWVPITDVSLNVNKKVKLVLLDSGNLILQDRNSRVVWQSFDFPTDTILPGMKLGFDNTAGKTWSIEAWKSARDPSPGKFSMVLDRCGAGWSFIMDRNKTQGLHWTGYFQNSSHALSVKSNNTIHYKTVIQPNATYMVFNVDSYKDFYPRYTLDNMGTLMFYVWSKGDADWTKLMQLPNRNCDYYGYCGSFSVCDSSSSSICSCFKGFEPVDSGNWDKQNYGGGCRRIKDSKPGFVSLENVTLPTNPKMVPEVGKVEDCETFCGNNESCNGYAYSGHKCWIFNGDVRNVQKLPPSAQNSLDIHIKVSAVESPKTTELKHRWALFISATAVLIIVAVAVFLGIFL